MTYFFIIHPLILLQGVDFPDVKIVCTAGLPNDLVEALQRGGRVGRRSGDVGLFVIFYESWALNVSVEEYAQGDLMDPDRPRGPLKPTSNARERAAYSSVRLVQCRECIRVFFAAYLNDTSSNGVFRLSVLILPIITDVSHASS